MVLDFPVKRGGNIEEKMKKKNLKNSVKTLFTV
jgi:hypothetical protein